ncbi:unnamed protein product, partial [Pelagomonas calceolata]
SGLKIILRLLLPSPPTFLLATNRRRLRLARRRPTFRLGRLLSVLVQVVDRVPGHLHDGGLLRQELDDVAAVPARHRRQQQLPLADPVRLDVQPPGLQQRRQDAGELLLGLLAPGVALVGAGHLLVGQCHEEHRGARVRLLVRHLLGEFFGVELRDLSGVHPAAVLARGAPPFDHLLVDLGLGLELVGLVAALPFPADGVQIDLAPVLARAFLLLFGCGVVAARTADEQRAEHERCLARHFYLSLEVLPHQGRRGECWAGGATGPEQRHVQKKQANQAQLSSLDACAPFRRGERTGGRLRGVFVPAS